MCLMINLVSRKEAKRERGNFVLQTCRKIGHFKIKFDKDLGFHDRDSTTGYDKKFTDDCTVIIFVFAFGRNQNFR